MRLSSGTRLGSYEIVAPIGAGGMGEVYRARDTRLGREVALKVLAPGFAEDTSRMARFEREAQVLASLNHPNIAAIYGIEQGAIVMELVEGEDLKGPVPMETALDYARQITTALEAAHEKGIIHRDLKPANIKIRPDGTVKLLDFGLAKAAEESPPVSGSPTDSPTLTLAMTQAGMILGTAAYMSPEQAAGKPVDKRADIWSFGVVLYELLTGRRLIEGETTAHILANVLTKELDLNRVEPSMRSLLRRCLQRDVWQRLRDIGDARLMLDELAELPVSDRRRRLPWVVVGAVLALGAFAAADVWLRSRPPEMRTVRFPLGLPIGTELDPFSLARPQAVPSPDGRYIAFVTRDVMTSKNNLWVRALNLATNERVDQTEGANSPFWSPDSQFIGFFAEQSLKKVSVSGGRPQTIFQSAGPGNGGAAWSKEGIIVFSLKGRLMRVPAGGGEATAVTALDASLGEDAHLWPQFLEDGKHVVYFAGNVDPSKSGIVIYEIGSSKRAFMLKNRSRGVFVPPGYLVFVREGTLFAQRLNVKTFQATGEPVSVASKVIENPAGYNASFAVSGTGVLVYRSGASIGVRQLTWYDRKGKRLSRVGSPGEYVDMSLSPDGKSVALIRAGSNGYEACIMDLGSGLVTQLTFDLMKRASHTPVVWSPDSERLALSPAQGPTEIVVATGATTHLFPRPLGVPSDWSQDGRFVMFADFNTVSLLPLVPERESGQRQPKVLLVSPITISQPRFSPDGRWVAYYSEEMGDRQVNVASLPSFADRRRISNGGGIHPVWRKDGKELFYLGPDSTVMATEVKSGLKFEAGTPKSLFKANFSFGPSFGYSGGQFGVSADGQRFLVAELVAKNEDIQDVVVLNWAAELKQ